MACASVRLQRPVLCSPFGSGSRPVCVSLHSPCGDDLAGSDVCAAEVAAEVEVAPADKELAPNTPLYKPARKQPVRGPLPEHLPRVEHRPRARTGLPLRPM